MLKKLFSPSGRVNRLQNLGYELLGLISMWVVGAVLAFAVFGIMYLVGVDNKSMTLPSGSELSIIFLLPTLVAMYSNIIIKIKRLHDMNLSGWWLPIFLLLGIPYIALYFWPGTNGKNRFDEDNDKTINNSNPSLAKAVYNHTKDIAAEVKPAISEYKQKHATSQTQAEDFVDEDTIYEQVMLEIEEDRKVKATWAKALAQSDGDRDKAESLYINFRVREIKNLQIIKNQEQKETIETNSNHNLQKNLIAGAEKSITVAVNSIQSIENKNATQDKYTLLRQFLDNEKEKRATAKTIIECSKETGIEISTINDWFSQNMILGYKQDGIFYIKTDQSGLANGETNTNKQESDWIYPVGLVAVIAVLIIFPFPINTIIALITPFILFYINKAVTSPVKKIDITPL